MGKVLHSLGKGQGVSSAKGPRVRREQTDWKRGSPNSLPQLSYARAIYNTNTEINTKGLK